MVDVGLKNKFKQTESDDAPKDDPMRFIAAWGPHLFDPAPPKWIRVPGGHALVHDPNASDLVDDPEEDEP